MSGDHVSAFQPISPRAALQLLEAADIGVDCSRLLADLAEAGLVKGYARLVEVVEPGKPAAEVRDGRIDRAIWKRIVAEDRVADVFGVGSVRLGEDATGRASVLGIRFDEKSVIAAAAEHGREKSAPPPQAKAPKAVVDQVAVAAKPAPTPPPVHVEQARRLLPPDAVAASIDEAAAVLGLSRGTVYKLMDAGTLESKKVGARRLVSADSIRALLA